MIVTILGAGGGVGQAAALCLKTTLPAGSELRLVDLNPAMPGIALDLAHIPTAVSVTGSLLTAIEAALRGSDIVLVTAGVPRKPGMTRDDLFAVNARIVADLTTKFVELCPEAQLAIVTNPVNSLLPVAAKVLEKHKKLDRRKLFGVTHLDVTRSQCVLGEVLQQDPQKIQVDVIGGHSAETMLPLLSRVPGIEKLSEADLQHMRKDIQEAGTKVVEKKAGAGSATLSMGYAAAEFVNTVVQGLSGKSARTCAYIFTDKEEVPFFAKPVMLGKEGIEQELEYGPLSEEEEKILTKIIPVLRQDIEKGKNFEI